MAIRTGQQQGERFHQFLESRFSQKVYQAMLTIAGPVVTRITKPAPDFG
jgi:hypothetical protein